MPFPTAEGHLTLGVRTLAVADANSLVPELSRHGAGVGAFGGIVLGEWAELRLGLEVRRLDERVGFCLDRCGYAGVDPPVRATSQIKAMPFIEARLRLVDVGPLSLRLGTQTGLAVGTSIDGVDPWTVGLVNSVEASLLVRINPSWSLDVTTSLQSGMHHVPSSPASGHTSTASMSVALVYVFPVSVPQLRLR